MIRRDVDPTHAPAVAGQVIRRRAYRCLDCHIYITSDETSNGQADKGYSP